MFERRVEIAARQCFGTIIVTLPFFYILENKFNCCADDSTLIAVVPSPYIKVIAHLKKENRLLFT